jgi:hypothetical protein
LPKEKKRKDRKSVNGPSGCANMSLGKIVLPKENFMVDFQMEMNKLMLTY